MSMAKSDKKLFSHEERCTILKYIEGDKSLRPQLEKIYNSYLGKIPVGTPHWRMCYLSELFSRVPDGLLKALCADQILQEHKREKRNG